MRYWGTPILLTAGGSLLLVAAGLMSLTVWVVVAIVGIALLLAALKRPELALLGILFLTSSVVFESDLPLIPVPMGSLHIPDLIVLGLFGLIILRWLAERDFTLVSTPLDAPVWTFYGATFLLTLWAIRTTSLDFNIALRGMRIVSYYLVFFLVTNLIRDEAQLWLLLNGFFALASFVAVVMFAQFVLGDAIPILPGRVETLMTEDTTYRGIVRILPPGQSVVMVSFLGTLFALLMDRVRAASLLWVGQAALLGLGLVFTFQRNFWVMALLALALFVLLVRGRDRRRAFGWSMALGVAGLVVVLVIFTQPDSQPARLVNASAERLNTLAGDRVTTDSSLRARDVEYEYAIPQIRRHLLTGLGAGARYRPFDRRIDQIGGFDGRAYIHNGHLWILLQAGLPGYLGLMWITVLFLWRGFKFWQYVPDSRIKGIMLSFVLVYLGGLLGSVTSPMFMQWFWTPVFGLMFGVNEVIIRLYVPEDVRAPRTAPAPNHWQIAANAYRDRAFARGRLVVERLDRSATGNPRQRRYSESTKRRAVHMCRSGKSQRQVARDLGVSPQSVANWVRVYGQEDPAHG
jgi:hypothetical protein